jgi:hypothetical protein
VRQYLAALAIVLCVVQLTGCTAYRTVSIADQSPDIARSSEAGWGVGVGDRVRVSTTSGETFVGQVMSVDSNALVVRQVGNFGTAETTVLASDLGTLEVEKATKFGKAAIGTTVFTAIVVIGVAVAFYSSDGIGGS